LGGSVDSARASRSILLLDIVDANRTDNVSEMTTGEYKKIKAIAKMTARCSQYMSAQKIVCKRN